MTAIVFDTHKFVRTLKDVGGTGKPSQAKPSQAEAFSEAFKEAQGESGLATKRDIDVLHRDMDARFIQTEQRLVIKLGGLMALPAYVARIRRKSFRSCSRSLPTSM
ncbi:MAG: DUF1640 domain-containing protein [Methylobacter sp.]